MRITSFSAQQFRNFFHIEPIVFPDTPLIAILAPNATGKTNLLEAIVMMLRGKSFRAQHDECVMWGLDSFIVQGEVLYKEDVSRLSVSYCVKPKGIRIQENDVPVSPVTFFGRYPLVLFLPEDAFLFNRGPAVRRNFINTSLAGSRHYLASVVQYHRALRQRNAALKSAASAESVEPWTNLLVQYAADVWGHRQLFADYLQSHTGAMYRDLFGENVDIRVSFVPGAADPESFQSLLADAWEYERRYRYTMYGPHRDDIEVRVNGRLAHTTMSRGQLRGLVISLKVAAYGYIKQLTGQDPLLLFDEVLSELDPGRQKNLLRHLPATQTILTCTAIPEEIKNKEDVFILDIAPLVQDVSTVEKVEANVLP